MQLIKITITGHKMLLITIIITQKKSNYNYNYNYIFNYFIENNLHIYWE